MINITKFIYVLLFLIPINNVNVIGFPINNNTLTNTSMTSPTSTPTFTTTSTPTFTTTTKTDNKDISLAEVIITIVSVLVISMIVVYCCCKCNEKADNERW